MASNTVIQLYACYSCNKIMDLDDIQTGKGCTGCGSFHVKYVSGTKWNILRYVVTHPSVIKLWIKENLLHLN